MNETEAVVVLNTLASAYRTEVTMEEVTVWQQQLAGVDVEVALDAVDNIIGISTFFPKIAELHNEIAAVHRQRAKDALMAPPGQGGPDRNCTQCHGQVWYEVEPVQVVNQRTGEVTHDTQWKPCQWCGPTQFDSWRRYCEERKALAVRKAPRSEAYATDITSLLAEARHALKNPS